MAAALALALLLPAQVYALDPTKSLAQYNSRSWTRQNGLPVNGITALTQTADGYIWMGTTKGLVRFDGIEFKRIDFAGMPGVRNAAVRAISPSRNGGLWVGLEHSGFGYFDGHVFSHRSRDAWGGEFANVVAIVEGDDGWLWLGTGDGVAQVEPTKGAYEVRLKTTDAANYDVSGGQKDGMGRLWFGTVDHGLHMWDHGRHWELIDQNLKRTIVYSAVVTPSDELLVGTANGVFTYDKTGRQTGLLLAGQGARALLVDRQGSVWIGAYGGLYRYARGELSAPRPGIASGAIASLCEDSEGSLWIGTQDGLTQLTDVKFPTLPAATDPKIQEVFAVAPSPRGGVWGATTGGVTYYDEGKLTSYGSEIGLPTTVFKRVFEAKNGDVYVVAGAKTLLVLADGKLVAQREAENMVVGMAEDAQGVVVSVGGNLFRANRGDLTPYPVPKDAPPMYWILNLLTAHDGALWVATVNGAFRFQDGKVQHWGKEEGVADISVYTLAEDADGVIWLGTQNGIARVKGDRVQFIDRDRGLFDPNVYAIVPDDLGDLWIDAGRGIYRVSRRAIKEVADGGAARVECTVFDGQESVQQTDKTIQERVGAKSRDGRIWFATAKGVVAIDPSHVPRNTIVPPVHIDGIQANGVELSRDATTVKPGRGELQFQFGALSYIAPQKIQFRYRLKGYDTTWIEVTNRRFAVYNNLRPGRYTFEVTAANADGVWNASGDSVAVELRPHFYQTTWFYLLVAVAVCGAFGAVYAFRVRHLKRKAIALQENRARLEAEVQRRTAELATANRELKHEVDERKNAELQLKQRTHLLEAEIDERKRVQREVERIHRELLEASRVAGMAEVATGVLHNVGNVLNSVNVSATLVIDRVNRSKSANVGKLAALLQEHAGDLGNFFLHDQRGQQVPIYLRTLADHLGTEQAAIVKELEGLRKNISHINEIVAMQQNHAKAAGLTEILPVTELVEDALRINLSALDRHGLTLVRDFQASPMVTVERHKVMQILINLIRNAKYACDESGRRDKLLTLRITEHATEVRIAVIDNGVGIPAQNLTRIFAHGFTTRKSGHGFGLHASALAARDLGGTLTASSEGPGHGATFVLALPLQQNVPNAETLRRGQSVAAVVEVAPRLSA